ncbi:uncharacterized protein (TIGR04222 family) [Murinocardiopsis flavida]|uniref:Uncharacterized protein (TIGR04222 family) n=1 Tax=Murinocardiopsis flavida TaxID=645275 RepID=A0A2P8D3S5_9ACTN|nr:TIGR04222 domain-containing membrane protein [Murinocardiopsis flavida]PSK91862.1 uncharacterized protein (TIGR04222 family) [Murinocardiopsis flavida]
MVIAFVLAVAGCQVAVGVCYLLTRLRYTRLRTRGPLRPATGPDDLSAYELAMLAGGNRRVGEVALAELYLSGRAVAWGRGAVARPGPEGTPVRPLSGAPFARTVDARLQSGVAVPVERLVATATRGDAATALLWRLRRLGLFFPPGALHGVGSWRHAAWGVHALLGVGGVLFAGYALVAAVGTPPPGSTAAPLLLGAVFLGYPFLLHLAHRFISGVQGAVLTAVSVTVLAIAGGALPRSAAAAALALFAGWFALYGCYRASGGKLGPRTVAGDTALAEARALAPGRGRTAVDSALRTTALVGLRGLCLHPRNQDGGADGGAGSSAGGGAGGGTEHAELAPLRAFASACWPRSGAGAVDRSVGGGFAADGGTGDWGGDGDSLAAPRSTQWRRSGGGRVG